MPYLTTASDLGKARTVRSCVCPLTLRSSETFSRLGNAKKPVIQSASTGKLKPQSLRSRPTSDCQNQRIELRSLCTLPSVRNYGLYGREGVSYGDLSSNQDKQICLYMAIS